MNPEDDIQAQWLLDQAQAAFRERWPDHTPEQREEALLRALESGKRHGLPDDFTDGGDD